MKFYFPSINPVASPSSPRQRQGALLLYRSAVRPSVSLHRRKRGTVCVLLRWGWSPCARGRAYWNKIMNYGLTMNSRRDYEVTARRKADFLFIIQQFSGGSSRIRTCDRRLRRPVLYPAELYPQIDPIIHRGNWGGRRVSNPPPPESQSGALPDELRPPSRSAENTDTNSPSVAGKLVGVERFELPTSCSQSRRATRLRYTPIYPCRRKRRLLFSGGRIILTRMVSVNVTLMILLEFQRRASSTVSGHHGRIRGFAQAGCKRTSPNLQRTLSHACNRSGWKKPGGAKRS